MCIYEKKNTNKRTQELVFNWFFLSSLSSLHVKKRVIT